MNGSTVEYIDGWLLIRSVFNCKQIHNFNKQIIIFFIFNSLALNTDWLQSKIVQSKIAITNWQSSYINFLEILQNFGSVYTNSKKYLNLWSWNWALWSSIQACYYRKENRIREEFFFHKSDQLNQINMSSLRFSIVFLRKERVFYDLWFTVSPQEGYFFNWYSMQFSNYHNELHLCLLGCCLRTLVCLWD